MLLLTCICISPIIVTTEPDMPLSDAHHVGLFDYYEVRSVKRYENRIKNQYSINIRLHSERT